LPGIRDGFARWNALVTLIFNDGGYGLIEWKQQNNLGSVLCSFGNPDFVKCRQYGTKGYRVESTADFIPTLKTALAQDVPSVIDCPVDYRENYRFTQRRETLVVAVGGSFGDTSQLQTAGC